jgi:AraC-like DNA-binding protein
MGILGWNLLPSIIYRPQILTDRLNMDRLSPLISRFSLVARVFYSGTPSGSFDFSEEDYGYLHILRKGSVIIHHPDATTIAVTQPSVIFYPRPRAHRMQIDPQGEAEIVCVSIDFGAGLGNPLMRALPQVLVVPLDGIAELMPALSLLFEEAFNARCGRQASLDRLAEYFLILLLRYAIETKLVSGGLLAGLTDKQLVKAITAMHERPEHNWSLEELAHTADMSRARFAAHFRHTIGATPLDYLTDWRIGVAQTLLKMGRPLKLVAPQVGYTHPVAFARVFTRRMGISPREWQVRAAMPSA